jgi:hypothetical protein
MTARHFAARKFCFFYFLVYNFIQLNNIISKGTTSCHMMLIKLPSKKLRLS